MYFELLQRHPAIYTFNTCRKERLNLSISNILLREAYKLVEDFFQQITILNIEKIDV